MNRLHFRWPYIVNFILLYSYCFYLGLFITDIVDCFSGFNGGWGTVSCSGFLEEEEIDTNDYINICIGCGLWFLLIS